MPPSDLQVSPVSSSAHQKQFMQFAWDHYRGDDNWIPPLRTNQKELLGYRKHPFYENAEIQTFLAMRAGKTVGRIAAIIDHGHNERYEEKRGMFGFFESIDEQAVADELFHAADQWLSVRGIDCVRGPNNPSLNNECGLLIEGFDSPPVFMMTYNKPYYGKLIEANGFQKSQDMYAYWGHVDMLADLDPKLQFVVDECYKRFDMKVRRVDTKNLQKDVESFMRIYNEGLAMQWGFVPLSEGEVKHTANGLKQLIVPEMTTVIEINGQAIGVVFGILDYNPIIKKIDGKLFPFGFLSILFGRRKLKRIRLVGTYVLPAYQKWGLGLVLMDRLLDDIKAWGVEEAEFSWVLESNKLSRGTLERGGAKRYKTYRMYDREIAGT